MIARILLPLALILATGNAFAQSRPDHWKCGALHSSLAREAARTTVAHPDEDKYDVKYVKLDVEMTNTSTTISGNVTTRAQVVSSGMSAYVFEMQPPLLADSVKINGILTTVATSGDTLTAALPATLAAGDIFTAQVFYHGTPISGTPANIKGINCLPSPSWGTRATFTLSEPYGAKDWWPCKQSLRDKIDSADIWITVDDTLKAGSNGLLQAVTNVAPGRSRYEWKHRYPVEYYLISAAVAPYVDYRTTMTFDGSTDTMLIQDYVYNNPATLPYFKNVIDSTALLVNYFSSIYGRYPFWKEKYGHCMAPLSGGMEHQTMTTLGYFEGWLVVHELGHQWFGDNVTCGTWRDIFMNEGFASYSEILYYDKYYSHNRALAEITEWQNNVMRQPGGALYVDDTTSKDRIFDRRLTYEKGACVIHTLRSVINNDTHFFDLLRAWQSVMADSTGTIENFRDLAITMLSPERGGVRFDSFFRQWLYGEGFPIYDMRWNQVGSDVYVHVSQSTSVPASVAKFDVPLELMLRSPTGDTLVRVANNQATQTFHFTWSKAMNALSPDPNQWLTDSISSIMRDVSLGYTSPALGQVHISPNPATDAWMVQGLPAGTTLSLADVTGRNLWSASVSLNTTSIPAAHLPRGIYLLRISSGEGERVMKVVRE